MAQIDTLKFFVINNKLTLLNENKLEQFRLAICNINTKKIQGVSAELGAFKGGASYYIATLLKRKHYVFDTFEGIQNSGDMDYLQNGAFANVTEENVQELLKNTKSVIVKGLFNGQRKSEQFCFSHFDGDTYQSCKDYLNYFYKNTVTDGYLFFDDYGLNKAKGVQIAVDEFLNKHNKHKQAFVSSYHQFCIIK